MIGKVNLRVTADVVSTTRVLMLLFCLTCHQTNNNSYCTYLVSVYGTITSTEVRPRYTLGRTERKKDR